MRLKGSAQTYDILCLFQFQFHKGAIKRFVKSDYANAMNIGFNSIKVRLKVKANKESLIKEWRFNSIKVRLKEATGEIRREATNAFQFHKGAIKRRSSSQRFLVAFRSFNSIKVRLKVAYEHAQYNIFDRFNSIKVRLKVSVYFYPSSFHNSVSIP